MSDRERILTATSARELFGDAVDDARLLRQAYAKLAKQFRPDEDPQAFAALRQWFERARDGGAEDSLASRLEIPDSPVQERVSIEQIVQSPQRVFGLDLAVLEDLLLDCDQVGVDLSPQALDSAEDAVLTGLAFGVAAASDVEFGPWLFVASRVFSPRQEVLEALHAVREAHASYDETRRSLSRLIDAHPDLGSAVYRACARATGSERDWLALDHDEWAPPKQVLEREATWVSACEIAARGPDYGLPLWLTVLGMLVAAPLLPLTAILIADAQTRWGEQAGMVMVTLLVAIGAGLLYWGHEWLKVWFARRDRTILRSRWMPIAKDGGVAGTLEACVHHGLWPHEFLALATLSGHTHAKKGNQLLASYYATHPLPHLERDLALLPWVLGPAMDQRIAAETEATHVS